MSNSSNAADIALAKQIARRAVARHDRKFAAQRNALQLALNIAQRTLADQSNELTDAATAVDLLQARVAELERERNTARADRDYYARNFNQVLRAMQGMRSDEFSHIADAVRRMQ